jgi:hypothetical protein
MSTTSTVNSTVIEVANTFFIYAFSMATAAVGARNFTVAFTATPSFYTLALS